MGKPGLQLRVTVRPQWTVIPEEEGNWEEVLKVVVVGRSGRPRRCLKKSFQVHIRNLAEETSGEEEKLFHSAFTDQAEKLSRKGTVIIITYVTFGGGGAAENTRLHKDNMAWNVLLQGAGRQREA